MEEEKKTTQEGFLYEINAYKALQKYKISTGGTAAIYVSGNSYSDFAYGAGDNFRITYDGTNVTFYKNNSTRNLSKLYIKNLYEIYNINQLDNSNFLNIYSINSILNNILEDIIFISRFL